VVFHRAIDLCPDPVAEVDVLLTLGVDRVLTSGGAAVALEGAKVIRRMVEVAGQSLTVMAGGGVRARNVRELVERTGVSEVHARDVRGMRHALSA
jgi:copper homeostasis protein